MRQLCLRCRWPVQHCWCSMLQPMNTETKLVILMHPHEIKKVKVNTGRFTALSFTDAEILVGISFDDCERLNELLCDEQYYPVLLYPREGAINVSEGLLNRGDLHGRRLLIIVVDATWFLAKKMMRMSSVLQKLPALMFTPTQKSQWKIKRQPDDLCLSTLEAVHQLMAALEKAGLGAYERPEQLPAVFRAVNEFQVSCANDPEKQSYRNDRQTPYSPPPGRTAGRTGKHSAALFWKETAARMDSTIHGEPNA